jgi:tetratricopeptide (TPR) repeat protein
MIEAADALIHFKTKDLDKAKLLLDKAYALDPKNPEIQILYGDIYSERNNGTVAVDYYKKALDLDPKAVRAIVAKGKLYKRSTNFDGAAEAFMEAIGIDDNFAPAHRELGEVYIKQGKLEKAKSEYVKYTDLSRNNCNARIRYASFLYLSKDYSGAIAEIAKLKQNCDSNNLTLLRVLSYCYLETKECAKGIETVERLFTLLPENKRIINDYEYYGKLMLCANRDSAGALALRKAYEMDKTRLDLLIDIGDAYVKMKKYDDAALAYREKVNAGRDVKSYDYFKLGQSYFYGEKFLEADTVYNKLTDIQPKWPSGFLWSAKNKSRIDSTSEAGLAKPHYEKYIELALADTANQKKYVGGLKEAYSYLASYYYLQKRDKPNAILYLRKKLEITEDPAEKKEISGIIKQIEEEKK